MVQAAMRRLEAKPLSAAEKRERRRATTGRTHEVKPGEAIPAVDITGSLTEDLEPMKEGDEIMSVSQGTKDEERRPVLWTRGEHDTGKLEDVLKLPPPLVIKYRSPQGGATEQVRKKRMLEELMTLRAIKQDSQPCPRCKVRISRSQGCNHMRCTNCDCHFCYRCGSILPPDAPYSHFGGTSCPTFDESEARRIVAAQQQGGGARGMDAELRDLQRQFGNQEQLFAHFQARQAGQRPGNYFREKQKSDSQCPTCRQWNPRNGGLNHARCHACRSSYCHNCGKRILGVVKQHFTGPGSCPQHGG